MESSIQGLIAAFSRLPGIGERSATRLAMHLLERDRAALAALERAAQAAGRVGHCTLCRRFTTQPVCEICRDSDRVPHDWCVVEHDRMIDWIEAGQSFHGRYFVLHGRLSPLNGIGVEALGVDALLLRLEREKPRRVRFVLVDGVEGRLTSQILGKRLAGRDPALDICTSFVADGDQAACAALDFENGEKPAASSGSEAG